MNQGLRRCRLVCATTLVVGALVLAWSLGIRPGDPLFYAATATLGAVWLAGALTARQALGHPVGRAVADERSLGGDVMLGLAVGLTLALAFLLGAYFVTLVPPLRAPVENLLDHAFEGALPVVVVLTLINGYAEEVFFRGALYDAFRGTRPVVATTVIYTVVTAFSGIWMLMLAGLMLGAVTACLRARTGGTGAAVVTHLVWQLGMIFLLPLVLDLWS